MTLKNINSFLRQLTFIILLGSLLLSCRSMQLNNLELIKLYNKSKILFQTDLLEHFPFDTAKVVPSGLTALEVIYPDSIVKCGKSMHLDILYSSQELKKIKQNISAKAKQKVLYGDTCLLIISKFNNFYDVKSYDTLTNYLSTHCKLVSSPIPNFVDDLKVIEIWLKKKNISEDLVVYTLDSKQGEFLGKKYLTEGLGLTKSWRNGYSRGVAISVQNNYVIYWVNVW